jgi:hypothetical protein
VRETILVGDEKRLRSAAVNIRRIEEHRAGLEAWL